MSDRLPRTPPEALARLEQAKANAQIHNRLYNEAGAHIQDENNRGQPTATDEECNELVDAHEDLQKLDAVSEDETRNDLHQCSDDQEKTRQELNTLQEKFTTASIDPETPSKDLQQCSDDPKKTKQTLEDLHKFDTVSTDETRKDLQQCRDDQEKTRQELETLQEELRDTKSQHATQLAALRQEDSDHRKEHDTKLRDAKSTTERAETPQIAETERAASLQQELEAETNRANHLKGELERTQQKVAVLEEQLADSRKDVESLNTSFCQLTESVRLSEELYKSCVSVAEAERDQTKQDYASLKRQHNQQGHDYGCLKAVHADTVEDLQVKMREAELADAQHNADQKEIGMYKRARSEVLQFLYRSVMLRPDVFADDQASSVLEITERRLRDCKDAKDRIDSVHTTRFDELNAAYVSLETYAQTMSERFETARSLISTRDRQISTLQKLVTTQESAHRTALQERNQLALALRDTSARYKQLVEYVENTILK